jgi:hypothetical protein
MLVFELFKHQGPNGMKTLIRFQKTEILGCELESTGIEQYSVLGTCEQENKPSFCINCCWFLEDLSNYIPLNRSCSSGLKWGAHVGSLPIFFLFWEDYKDRQCMHNATWRRVCETIVAAERNVYYIFWVCVCSIRYPACNAHAPYCRLLPVRLYNIPPNYLLHGKIFGKTMLLKVKCVLIYSKFLYEIVLILRTVQPDAVNVRRSSC